MKITNLHIFIVKVLFTLGLAYYSLINFLYPLDDLTMPSNWLIPRNWLLPFLLLAFILILIQDAYRFQKDASWKQRFRWKKRNKSA